MDRDLLPVEILPGLVELRVDGGIEAQGRELQEHPDGGFHLLDESIWTAHTDIRLTADDRLRGNVLGFQVSDLDIDALLPCALEGGKEMKRFDARDIAERHPHLCC